MNKSIERAVLFADIADNTGLLERLGQARALDVLSQCLARLFEIGRDHGGNVIKAMGDGAICRFANFEDAVRAACRMHETLEHGARIDRIAPAMHIGVHYGFAFMDYRDVRGGEPNLASCMTNVATPRQILPPRSAIKRLQPGLAGQTRYYDVVAPKGGQPELAIFEVS